MNILKIGLTIIWFIAFIGAIVLGVTAFSAMLGQRDPSAFKLLAYAFVCIGVAWTLQKHTYAYESPEQAQKRQEKEAREEDEERRFRNL